MARALLLFAVASGCFSVYCACIVQGTVGKLYNPERLKDWIRLPPPPGPSTRKPHDPHSVSLAAVLILSAPLTLVDYSLFSFLIGLAVYQGFIWTRKLDLNAGNGDSRDIFITYVVKFGACLLFYAFALSTKMIENLLRRGRMSGWDQNIIMEDMHLSPAQQQYAQSLQHLSLPAVAENANARVNLATALELAAQAHEQCAEADRRVALLFQQSRDDLHDLPHPIQRWQNVVPLHKSSQTPQTSQWGKLVVTIVFPFCGKIYIVNIPRSSSPSIMRTKSNLQTCDEQNFVSAMKCNARILIFWKPAFTVPSLIGRRVTRSRIWNC